MGIVQFSMNIIMISIHQKNILMIKHVLERLSVLEPSLKNEKRYIRILLQTNAQELVKKLKYSSPPVVLKR